MRKRHQRNKRPHFCLLVNPKATNYSQRSVKQLIGAIRRTGSAYTVIETRDATDLTEMARIAARLKRDKRSSMFQTATRGKVTALIACGGDGTFNLVARAATEADMPVGVLPMGRYNSIARSLVNSIDITCATKIILGKAYARIDTATVLGQFVVGSVGVGFVPELMARLEGRTLPRFGLGWKKLGSEAGAAADLASQTIRVDSFRFELQPRMVHVNLLRHTLGLNFSPASIPDDGKAEVVFDVDSSEKDFSDFARQVFKGEQLYGNKLRQFRGSVISFQPVKGQTLFIDGELIPLPVNVVEIKVHEKKLKVYC